MTGRGKGGKGLGKVNKILFFFKDEIFKFFNLKGLLFCKVVETNS